MVDTYSIQLDADAAVQAMQQYPARTARATMRSLNRALTSGRATMASLIAKDMGLKVGVVKDAIGTRQATVTNLEIRLNASLKRIPLQQFGAKQTSRGVTYKIGTSGRSRVANAFLAAMSSGHEGVFVRTSKKRLPIRELYGPSIGHVFEKYRDQGVAAVTESFQTNLAHELAFAETASA